MNTGVAGSNNLQESVDEMNKTNPSPICTTGQVLDDKDRTNHKYTLDNNTDVSEMKLLQLFGQVKRALLVGSVSVEEYVHTVYQETVCDPDSTSISNKEHADYYLGGVASVARHVKSLGAHVDILTVLGTDEKNVTRLLEEAGIRSQGIVFCDHFKSNHIVWCIANGRCLSKFDKCCTNDLTDNDQDRVLQTFENVIQKNTYDMIAITDNSDEVFTGPVVKRMLALANGKGVPTIAVPATSAVIDRYTGCTYVKVNQHAAETFCNTGIECTEDIEQACKVITEKLKATACILGLDEMGIAVYSKTDLHTDLFGVIDNSIAAASHKWDRNAMHAQLAGWIFCLSHGMSLTDACRFSISCAADVKRNKARNINLLNVIPDRTLQTKEEVVALKRIIPTTKHVVLTTGCFDLFHYGHAETLRQAKEVGDILIVALNSDISVKKNKGDSRPIYNLRQRIGILLAVRYVDFVVVFDERKPDWIINVLDPDIFVKGEDYTESQLRSMFPNLRRVYITKRDKDSYCSTSGTLRQIRDM